jgi:hypothetical protein
MDSSLHALLLLRKRKIALKERQRAFEEWNAAVGAVIARRYS